MRRAIAAGLLVVAAVACSGGPAPDHGRTMFLLLAHQPLMDTSSFSDDQLLAFGRQACAQMDHNVSSDQIVADIGGNPEPGSARFNEFSEIVVAAASELCPAHKGEFQSAPGLG